MLYDPGPGELFPALDVVDMDMFPLFCKLESPLALLFNIF